MKPGEIKILGMVLLAAGVFLPIFSPSGVLGAIAGVLIVAGIVLFIVGNRGLKAESEAADADTAADPEPADPAGGDPS